MKPLLQPILFASISLCIILLIFINTDLYFKHHSLNLILPKYTELQPTLQSPYSPYGPPPTNTTSILLHPENKAKTESFKPISYGYTSSKARIFYKLLPRKKCSLKSLFNTLESGEIQVDCKQKPLTALLNAKNYSEKIGKVKIWFELQEINDGLVLDDEQEYFMVKCGGFNDVVLRNVRNRAEVKKTKERAKMVGKEYKTKKMRPLTVVVLVIDSASRQLVYRNLPETIQFLNENLKSEGFGFKVYDFLLNNAVRAFTVPNLVPLTLGRSFSSFEKDFKGKKIDESPQIYLDYQQNYSLWSHFKKMGFMTVFISDAVAEGLSEIYGRKVLVDHQVNNFWKLGKQFFGLDEFKDRDVCIGSYPPHYYTLSYLQQVMKNYSGMNKFMFAHINIAHETTGSRLNIADKDFVEYFKRIFEEFDRENEDFVFMITGDHGTSKGDFMTIEGLAEKVMASHFLIANKELIERLNADQNLRVNTKRPVSRYDWYKTLRFLSYFPYKNLKVSSPEYKHIETDLPAVSLFHKAVDGLRTCEDLGVYPTDCLSRSFSPFNITEKKTLIAYFIKTAKNSINGHLKKRVKCEPIEKLTPIYVEKFSFKEEYPIFSSNYLNYVSADDSKGEFLLHTTQGYRNQYNNLGEKTVFGSLKKTFYKKEGRVAYYTIEMLWEIYRLAPLKTVSEIESSKKCTELMKFNYNLYLSENNETCLITCERLGLECNRPVFYDSILGYLERNYGEVRVIGEFDSVEVANDAVFVGSNHFCNNIARSGKGVCFCSMIKKDPWSKVNLYGGYS